MSNATIYCAAPTRTVLPLLGDPSDYAQVADENDYYTEYQSLVEVWAPSDAQVLRDAQRIATDIAAAGIGVAIALDGDPEPFGLAASA